MKNRFTARIVLFITMLLIVTTYNNAYAASPVSPILSLITTGTNVRASWGSVDGATGYTLLYAPFPEGSPIGSMDMGMERSFTIDLPLFSTFYVAVQAYNPDGHSSFSNITSFEITEENSTINSCDIAFAENSKASVAVGNDGIVHVIYFDQLNTSFVYARKQGDHWETHLIEDVHTSKYITTAIAVDSGGVAHLLYQYNVYDPYHHALTQIQYARFDGAMHVEPVKTIEESSTFPTPDTEIVFTQDGIVNLLFSGRYLYHARKDSESWRSKTLLSLYDYTWSAVSKGTEIFVTYSRRNDYGSDKQFLLAYLEGAWYYWADLPFLSGASIDVDSQGDVILMSRNGKRVAVRRNTDGDYRVIESIQISLSNRTLKGMKLDDTDTAYGLGQSQLQGLYYLKVNPSGVVTERLVDEQPCTGLDFAIDAGLKAHIIYHDQVSGYLKYAHISD